MKLMGVVRTSIKRLAKDKDRFSRQQNNFKKITMQARKTFNWANL